MRKLGTESGWCGIRDFLQGTERKCVCKKKKDVTHILFLNCLPRFVYIKEIAKKVQFFE